jgi:hypothetical protein
VSEDRGRSADVTPGEETISVEEITMKLEELV